ncbi:MAG: tRNA (N(6)-L-threonylcarbamoyladenosine(37)-C(2))-methylthiotransferase MtaB [Thermodesulfobacteria bacterium]|nr:tRNA (N(6)-L-threonylcarbamoyladenosine(37)-C(2))-methylthiotransferase MtaB [Thermodesulfobacteriota bacterium]
MKTFYIKTLGCKVNQIESEYIADTLIKQGYQLVRWQEADVLLLNTCIVTHKAEKECRKIIRKWKKETKAILVIMGCYPQAFLESLKNWITKENLKERTIILGQVEKLEVADVLKALTEGRLKLPYVKIDGLTKETSCKLLECERLYFHSRAFLKVQDGCDQFCTYCIVPYARGKPRSVPLEEIIFQAEKLVKRGYRELVLTGIHLGKWGKDLGLDFVTLLTELEKHLKRLNIPIILRLSSIEPNEVTQKFLNFIKTSKFIAPHFHIPLQSGSNRILKAMNRPYTREFYEEVVFNLKEIFPDATIGADVIVGFPGETEEDFKETYELIENSPLNWLHIFPYSVRPGTLAEKINPKVPPSEIKFRESLLKSLIQKKRKEFLKTQLNKTKKAIVEKKEDDFYRCITENYLTVYVKGKELKPKQLILLSIKSLNEKILGEILKVM